MERKKEEILDFVNFDGPEYKKRNYYAQVSNLLSEFEKEIREDQDKITRHACADNINESTCHIFNQGFFNAVSYDEVVESILSTKAL